MVNPTDPNRVRMTGENSFIRLFGAGKTADQPEDTRASHWRVLWSPGGQGHVLYVKSDVTDNQVRIYSDNIAAARYLQAEIESMLFPGFADEDLPVINAIFTRSGDGVSTWSETVESDEDTITLTWYDFLEPFVINSPAGSVAGRAHGVYSCFIPALRAQLTVNGAVAAGKPLAQKRGDKDSSTACLAWSETWVAP